MAKKKKNKIRFWIFIGLLILGTGFLAVQLFHKVRKLEKIERSHPVNREPKTAAKPELSPKDRIAILIDDLGPDLKEFNRLKALDSNLSFAVLPFQRFSVKIARDAHLKHHDVLLHLPMEPEKNGNPGKGAIYHTMSPEEILRQTRLDLQALPFIQGVNNHMGSRITSDREEMKLILNEIKMKNLFFVDSRTSGETVAFQLAQDLGIRSAERQVFIDDTDNPEDIRGELSRLTRLSHQRGSAIAIGHPRKNTVKALKEYLPRMEKEGIKLVPISTLVK